MFGKDHAAKNGVRAMISAYFCSVGPIFAPAILLQLSDSIRNRVYDRKLATPSHMFAESERVTAHQQQVDLGRVPSMERVFSEFDPDASVPEKAESTSNVIEDFQKITYLVCPLRKNSESSRR